MEEKNENYIRLSLGRLSRVQQLNDWIVSGKKKGINEFDIQVVGSGTYSNVCAPIAGVIEFYRKQGLKINVKYNPKDYVRHTKFWAPISVENCEKIELAYPFDKVWTFETDDGVCTLVDSYILHLREADILEEGVITSFEWCINEVMDNVLQHSGHQKGFVMAQIHKQSKVFAFCVFDYGMGIYNSLKKSKHHPLKPIDAITLALQERVTRDDRVGQGNGLWGVSSIVAEAKGQLEISSCGARYTVKEGEFYTSKENGFTLSPNNGTSYIDIRINYDREIDIVKAIGKYTQPVDLWLENLEDENDNYIVSIANMSSGTGTRQSAEKLRNLIMNIVHTQKKIVILDFEGVNMISSSFADELIGKIISEYGFIYFINAFRIKNLNEASISIMNRSVGQRMAQKYYEEAIEEVLALEEYKYTKPR